MLLIAGISICLWMMLPDLKNESGNVGAVPTAWFLAVIAVLGGVSLIGLPMLIWERCRSRKRPWGPGKLIWFSEGMAAWLMWPPVIIRRVQGGKFGDTMTGACYAYGTPLMALWMISGLLAGGWLRKRRRRRIAARSWREQFGLILGLAWACTGLYILYLLYTDDFRL